MKRALFDTIMVRPHTIGEAMDRGGYLSAVLGMVCTDATGTPTVALKLQHADTADDTFIDVPDTLAIVGRDPVLLTTGGAAQINIDLLGCKRYVKILAEVTGTATLAYAIALGDAPEHPTA